MILLDVLLLLVLHRWQSRVSRTPIPRLGRPTLSQGSKFSPVTT